MRAARALPSGDAGGVIVGGERRGAGPLREVESPRAAKAVVELAPATTGLLVKEPASTAKVPPSATAVSAGATAAPPNPRGREVGLLQLEVSTTSPVHP
jgi:hypothetical protein